MEAIKKNYIVDENNQKVAVQIELKTFEKIEEILENYALVQLMKENESDETLDVEQAKAYYEELEKASWKLNTEKIFKRDRQNYFQYTRKNREVYLFWTSRTRYNFLNQERSNKWKVILSIIKCDLESIEWG